MRNQRGRRLVACALAGVVLLTGCTEDDPRTTIEVALGESGSVSDWLDVAIREAVSECESDDSLEEVRFTFKRNELESGIAREYYIGNFPGGITCQSLRPSSTTGPDGDNSDTESTDADDEVTTTTGAESTDEDADVTSTTEAESTDSDEEVTSTTESESTATTEAEEEPAEEESTTTTSG